MAEPTRTGFWAWIVRQAPDWLGDALMGALLVWILGKRPAEGGGKGPLVDVHGELLADLQKAVPDMSQPIWQRHKAAVAAKKDDEWETLLSKVSKDARPEVYAAMNKMEDAEFEQCLDLLRHNRVFEFLERVALYASPRFKAAWAKVKAMLDDFNAWLEREAEAMRGSATPILPPPGLTLRGKVAWRVKAHPVAMFFLSVFAIGALVVLLILFVALAMGKEKGGKPCQQVLLALREQASTATDDTQRAQIVEQLAQKHTECLKKGS